MKVAITAKGGDLTAEVDPRFGRAPFILVVETDTMEYEVLDNSSNVRAFKGAGIQTATLIADKGVELLVTGYCGPNAFRTVQAAGIRVVGDVAGRVEEVLDKVTHGSLQYLDNANVDGHW